MKTMKREHTRMRSWTRSGLGIPMLFAGLALAAPSRGSAQSTEAAAREAPTAATQRVHPTLQVDNANWLDVHVYLVRDGISTSLGFLTGPGNATIALPDLATWAGSDVQLMVLPVGSRQVYLSPPVIIGRGDEVDLRIENNLALSSVTVAPHVNGR